MHGSRRRVGGNIKTTNLPKLTEKNTDSRMSLEEEVNSEK